MKLLNFMILSIVALLLPLQSFGGAGSHGGDFRPSTPEEVKFAISQSRITYEWILREVSAELKEGNAIRLNNPQLREIFTKIIALNDVQSILKNTGDLTFKSDEPCFYKGVEKDSALMINPKTNKNDLICLNVRTIKRYPKEALGVQIGALITHELSHEAGYGEDIAKNVVQAFALHLMENPCSIEVMLKVPGETNTSIIPGDSSLPDRRVSIFLQQYGADMERLMINSDGGALVRYDLEFQCKTLVGDTSEIKCSNSLRHGELSIETQNQAQDTKILLRKEGSSGTALNHNTDGSLSSLTFNLGSIKEGNLHDMRATSLDINFSVDGKAFTGKSAYISPSCFN